MRFEFEPDEALAASLSVSLDPRAREESKKRDAKERNQKGISIPFDAIAFFLFTSSLINLLDRPEKKKKKKTSTSTEASLSGLDPLLASLRRKASRADAAILEALREQCSGFVAEEEEQREEGGAAAECNDENGGRGKPAPTTTEKRKTATVGASLAAAAEAAASLSLRVSDVGAKAAASEALVDDICRDVRALDAAKGNLSRGIAALRRLGMLSAATDQLEAAAARGDLGEAARLLGAVNELGDFFAPHAAAVPAVAASGPLRCLVRI